MGLTLAKGLRLLPRSDGLAATGTRGGATVAFVGAGGKSTSMFRLARELGPKTLITTTTHLGVWQRDLADRHVTAGSPAELASLDESAVTLVTGPAGADGRLSSINPPVLEALLEIARAGRRDLLIEADGARQRPLKAPATHEPQVPACVETVVVVAGLHGLGAELTDAVVHRAEIFGGLSGLKRGELVGPEALVRMLLAKHGGLQGIPPGARRVVLFNQADTAELQAMARAMVDPLLPAYDAVIIGDIQNGRVYAVYEPSAGIVLAAGGATRFRAPKQLVLWRGEPLVRVAARTALDAGLSPVIVVTGAYSDQVRVALDGLPVQIVENTNWQEGQGSSVSRGASALPSNSGAALFLLADQPMVTPSLVHALLEAHASDDACVVAPLVQESRRANPVLFDSETFGRLRHLQGDVGGRSIIPEYRVRYVPWHDAELTRDIDTQSDYKDLLESNP